jgi:hypothetical protein
VGGVKEEDDMGGYEMHGGWMALWGLAGLLVLGIVVYTAVRLALGDHRGNHPDDHDHDGHCC